MVFFYRQLVTLLFSADCSSLWQQGLQQVDRFVCSIGPADDAACRVGLHHLPSASLLVVVFRWYFIMLSFILVQIHVWRFSPFTVFASRQPCCPNMFFLLQDLGWGGFYSSNILVWCIFRLVLTKFDDICGNKFDEKCREKYGNNYYVF